MIFDTLWDGNLNWIDKETKSFFLMVENSNVRLSQDSLADFKEDIFTNYKFIVFIKIYNEI